MDPCDYKPIPKTSYEEFMKEKYWAKNRPMSIHFELTQRCNLRCIHCLFTHETADELSTEEILRILMQLKEIGVFSLSLSGGEIFARKDIEAILDFLMIQRFMVIIYTNGTLLNQCIIKKIAALNPSSVEISIYGATPEVHDAITGVTGSFEKTIGNIRELRKNHVPTLFKGFS
jgi:MoaA/NifB/PqqE/SkfB family radical SAM enzyme